MSIFIENLEAMLEQGSDSALLRFSLGSAYFKQGDTALAIKHLRRAVELDKGYSAAWKVLGQAQAAAGLADAAMETYRQGISVAADKGDQQVANEMQVFLRRLERAGGSPTSKS